jgi:hypothetical protein
MDVSLVSIYFSRYSFYLHLPQRYSSLAHHRFISVGAVADIMAAGVARHQPMPLIEALLKRHVWPLHGDAQSGSCSGLLYLFLRGVGFSIFGFSHFGFEFGSGICGFCFGDSATSKHAPSLSRINEESIFGLLQ